MNNFILYYQELLATIFILSPIIFFILLFVSAPYGRHARENWGISISTRLGWIIMEMPALFIFYFIFKTNELIAYVFFILWGIHYIHRAVIFPFQFRNPLKPMPVTIIGLGAIFNLINAYINGVSLTMIHSYPITWVSNPCFIVGILLFISGFFINRQADFILQHLRRPGESEYKIPQGGLYRWISCPNYLGEIIQWLGWALATWSLAGFAFFIWTIANLVPRALKNNEWYRDTFPQYPKNRRALIPWVF